MGRKKLNTQAIGLDIGLSFVKWLTGAENLHYGLWDGLDVSAMNLRAAQDAYTDKFFSLLPEQPCRILDIGGGAGETAKKLIALGHDVTIVIPSPFLADRCKQNAPEANVHLCTFEDFEATGTFDICMFSESFQYIPLGDGLSKCLGLLNEGGQILLCDCFRSEDFTILPGQATVGGGHPIAQFRATLADLPLDVTFEEDITTSVAPSVEIEQGLFNVIGYGITRVDQELLAKRPRSRWMINKFIRSILDDRKRSRLDQRLNEFTRNRDVFGKNNVYLMMALKPKA